MSDKAVGFSESGGVFFLLLEWNETLSARKHRLNGNIDTCFASCSASSTKLISHVAIKIIAFKLESMLVCAAVIKVSIRTLCLLSGLRFPEDSGDLPACSSVCSSRLTVSVLSVTEINVH